MTSHVLIGGTGAVGSVYAYHLVQGGAKVALFVRPKRRGALEKQGYLVLHDLTTRFYTTIGIDIAIAIIAFCIFTFSFSLPLWLSTLLIILLLVISHRIIPIPPAPHRVLRDFTVCSEMKELSGHHYIWLCISSAQLREPGFIQNVVANMDDKQVIVSLTPGNTDIAYILSHFPHPNRIIEGTIPIISYQAPLVGERTHPTTSYQPKGVAMAVTGDKETATLQGGIAVFVPPFQKVVFSGDIHATAPILKAMNAGGLSSVHSKTPAHLAFLIPQSLLTSLLMALEMENWKFGQLQSSTYLKQAADAAKEMLGIVHHEASLPTPFIHHFIHPLLFHFIILLAPLLMPFDLEPYIQYHFTKVDEQTALFGDNMVSYAQQHGLKYDALYKLLNGIKQKRAQRE